MKGLFVQLAVLLSLALAQSAFAVTDEDNPSIADAAEHATSGMGALVNTIEKKLGCGLAWFQAAQAQSCAKQAGARQPAPVCMTAAGAEQDSKNFLENLDAQVGASGANSKIATCQRNQLPEEARPHMSHIFESSGASKIGAAVHVLSQSGAKSSIYSQLRALKLHKPKSDLGLIYAIAFRESGAGPVYTTSDQKVDTYAAGGLDYIGMQLDKVKASGQIPPPYGRNWTQGYKGPNEHDVTIQGGSIPRKELMVAYGVWLNMMRERFEREALRMGFTQDDLDRMPRGAKAAWNALFFGGSGGASCSVDKKTEK